MAKPMLRPRPPLRLLLARRGGRSSAGRPGADCVSILEKVPAASRIAGALDLAQHVARRQRAGGALGSFEVITRSASACGARSGRPTSSTHARDVVAERAPAAIYPHPRAHGRVEIALKRRASERSRLVRRLGGGACSSGARPPPSRPRMAGGSAGIGSSPVIGILQDGDQAWAASSTPTCRPSGSTSRSFYPLADLAGTTATTPRSGRAPDTSAVAGSPLAFARCSRGCASSTTATAAPCSSARSRVTEKQPGLAHRQTWASSIPSSGREKPRAAEHFRIAGTAAAGPRWEARYTDLGLALEGQSEIRGRRRRGQPRSALQGANPGTPQSLPAPLAARASHGRRTSRRASCSSRCRARSHPQRARPGSRSRA
jgi:hypothetical protein